MIGKYFEKLRIKTKSVSNNVPLSQYGEHQILQSNLPKICPNISLEKQNKKLLIRTKDPETNYRFGGHCNLHTLSGLCKFCNLIRMKSSFPVFDELLFLCFLVFTKICHIISSSNKYPPCWSFKLAKSNQFKVDIKSKTVLT